MKWHIKTHKGLLRGWTDEQKERGKSREGEVIQRKSLKGV